MVSINVMLQVWAPPENVGYRDTAHVIVDEHFRFACPARVSPNHRGPKPAKIAWRELYGCVAPGHYDYRCIEHDRYGKCLLVNGGGVVPSRNPNPNHKGKKILTEVFVHSGETDLWPGSAGCPTVHPVFWSAFTWWFEPSQTGRLYVLDFAN